MRQNHRFLSFVFKIFLVGLLVAGVFGIVYLRSGFLKLEYGIGELENKKTDALRERKMLLAEKTSLLSFAKLEDSHYSTDALVMPDRIKVVHMDKNKRYMPYRASLEKKHLSEP